MTCKIFVSSPIGRLALEETDGFLTRLSWCMKSASIPGPETVVEKRTPFLGRVARQLEEYFQGKRHVFDIPLAPRGTPFMQSVWDQLILVPYGQTASYRDIAERVGNPKAVRAVGGANHRNPIPLFIPCHRIIGTNGKLVGFASGLEVKQQLLDLERKWSNSPCPSE